MKRLKDYSDLSIMREYNKRFKVVKEQIKDAGICVDAVREVLMAPGVDQYREHFAVLFLDGQHALITAEILFDGSINTSPVFPRIVIEKVLEHHAVSIILAHNHPSGSLAVSPGDRAVTKKIQQACAAIDVDVLDHIILGGAEYYSFEEARIM